MGSRFLSVFCKLNGWNPDPSIKDGAQSKFASHLHLSKQYISELLHTKKGISADAMMRIILYLGMENRDWSRLFYFRRDPAVLDETHQSYNQAKLLGQMPYAWASPSAELRRQDNPNVEEQSCIYP